MCTHICILCIYIYIHTCIHIIIYKGSRPPVHGLAVFVGVLVLHYVILYIYIYIYTYYIILYHITLCYFILYHIMLHYII